MIFYNGFWTERTTKQVHIKKSEILEV